MYGRARIIPPVEVTAALGNNGFVIDEGGGPVTVTLSDAFYWPHADEIIDISYPGIYHRIEDALNASGSLSNTYAFEAATPTKSHRQISGGIALRATAGGQDFSVEFTNVAFTMDDMLFGGVPGTYQVDVASVTEGSEKVAYMPYCRGPEWLTFNEFAWCGPTDLRSEEMYEVVASDGDPLYAYEYDWSRTGLGEIDRPFIVPWIPAAHVKEYRANDGAYARTGKLAQGDVNNALQTTWRKIRTLRGEGRDSDCFLVYDVSDLLIQSHSYDIGRLAKAEHRKHFEAMLDEARQAGEFYDLKTVFRLKTKLFQH